MTVKGERSSCDAFATNSLRSASSLHLATDVAHDQQLTLRLAGSHDVEGEPAIAVARLEHTHAFLGQPVLRYSMKLGCRTRFSTRMPKSRLRRRCSQLAARGLNQMISCSEPSRIAPSGIAARQAAKLAQEPHDLRSL